VSTSSPKQPSAIDFKSATLYAVRMVLHSSDTDALLNALKKRMKDAGSFFENEPVVLDASQLDTDIDWDALTRAARQHSLHPVGAVASPANLASAQKAGLAVVDLANPAPRSAPEPAPEKDIPSVAAQGTGNIASESSDQAAQTDITSSAAAPAAAAEPAPAAMVINRPLRSGQRIYARNTDLIVIGPVSQGAEVIADGNIHVYGPLRGKAMAGARGDTTARIFTTQLNPELLAIAGIYRVVETALDASMQNQACVVHLENDSLRIRPLEE
jgi:septum site-determining protein MinC